MTEDTFSIESLLQNQPEIANDTDLLHIIISVFEFTQYLLDDDENLTKSANLTSGAKEKLDKRIEELFLQNTINPDIDKEET